MPDRSPRRLRGSRARASPALTTSGGAWIAENLLLDLTPECLLATMVARGFSPQEAAREIDLALQKRSFAGQPAVASQAVRDDRSVEPRPQAAPTRVEPRESHGDAGSAPASAPRVEGAGVTRVDDEWRRWIAENLLLGATHESLIDAMSRERISAEEAAAEIDLALHSPYVRGSERLSNRLRKREWLLTTYRKLHRLHPKSGEIERRHRLSREEFLEDYYTHQSARHHHRDDGRLAGLEEVEPRLLLGEIRRPRGRSADRPRCERQLRNRAREVFEPRCNSPTSSRWFARPAVTNDFYLTANNNSRNKKALPELWDDIVQIPEYLDGRDRLGGFFWMGPAGYDHPVPPRSDQQLHGAR